MDITDWVAISVAIYVITAAGMAWHVFTARGASVFDPVGQYILFVSLFTLPLPVRSIVTLEIEGNVTPHLPQLMSAMPIAVLLAAASLPLFAWAYYSDLPQYLASRLWVPKQHQRRDTSLRAAVILGAFSLALIWRLAEEEGGLLAFLLLGYGSSEETFGRGYLAIGFPWLFVASMLLLYRYAISRSGLDALVFIATIVVVIGIQVLTGNRSMLVYIALVLMIFIHHGIVRISPRILLPVGLFGFLALNLHGMLRGSNYESIVDFFEQSSAILERVGEDSGDGLFYTLTIGEFVVPFEVLVRFVHDIGITEDPWFGLSFLRTPLYSIPSAIFPDRPPSLGAWYMSTFYGSGYGLNEGRAFLFLAEGYLNFGPVGIAVISVLWGTVWGTLHRWMQRAANQPAAVLCYALVLGFMFRCVRGDFSTLTAGIAQQSLIPALIGLWMAGVGWVGFSKRAVARELS
jgi:hypothetical protein